MEGIDKFQERYLGHQDRKKKILAGEFEEIFPQFHSGSKDFFKWIVSSRVSQRIFIQEKISDDDVDFIKNAIVNTPSSCNRQAIQIKVVESKEEKALLQEFLVGGVNWIGKADKILLLMADMDAYKSPAEVDFMPYLDAGFIGMSVYYATTVLSEIGSCFVNPNIREINKERFNDIFNKKGYRFCGAIAIGHYKKRAFKIQKTNQIFI